MGLRGTRDAFRQGRNLWSTRCAQDNDHPLRMVSCKLSVFSCWLRDGRGKISPAGRESATARDPENRRVGRPGRYNRDARAQMRRTKVSCSFRQIPENAPSVPGPEVRDEVDSKPAHARQPGAGKTGVCGIQNRFNVIVCAIRRGMSHPLQKTKSQRVRPPRGGPSALRVTHPPTLPISAVHSIGRCNTI